MQEIKALQVSKPVDLNLLTRFKPTENRGGFLSRLFRAPELPAFSRVIILQIHHRFTAVAVDRYIELYELEQTETGAVKATLCHEIDCGQYVKLCCTNWCSGSTGNLRSFLAIANERSLQLYLLDLKSKKLTKKSDNSLKGIQALSFLGQTKLLTMVDHVQLIKFDCATGSLVRKPTLKVSLDLPAGTQISSPSLLTTMSDELEDTFHYFFFTCKQEGETFFETVYVKELVKRNDGIQQGHTFKIYEIEGEKHLFKNAQVIRQKDYFGILIDGEIEIVRKRHNSYLFFDSILRKSDTHTLFMLEDGLIFSVDDTKAELSKASLGDLKCELRNLDVIYFDEEQKIFKPIAVQPIMLDKSPTFGIFFQQKDTANMRVLTMARVNAMSKLMDLVKKEQLKLPVIQEIGVNLGISKRDFYLELYRQSQKELKDVNDKLLETEDVFLIKREMKFFLRRKRVPLFELLKVYTRIYELIRSRLRESLDPKMLKAYIKMNFLYRKLKIQPDMINTIGFVEFMDIKKKSVGEMLRDCISGDMKLSELCTKDREKAGKQIQKYEAIMRDVLSEFRIVLLENYDSFLKEIISPFSNKLELLFDKYSFILPRHPYESEFKYALSIQSEPEPVMMNKSVVDLGGSPQPKIFNPVKEIEWNLEMSRERIIQQLSEYNLTSAVTSAIDTFVSSNYYTANRLSKHAMIPSTRNEYIQHISKNSGLRLFLKACEFANELNIKNESYSPKRIVERFQKNNNLTGDELTRCTFYSELHLFMLRQEVGDKPCMEKLLSLSEEDLIAVFFLGNEQKHKLILRELRNLYDDPLISRNSVDDLSLFDGVMEKFVNSENCSPVEIRLLTDEIKEMGPEFQQANQQLIRIIINGFCQRLEVREEDHIQQFIDTFQPIHLNQELNEQMRHVVYIKNELGLFEHFHCEKESVLQLEREGKIVMSRILENYFLGDIKSDSLVIDNQFIALDTPRNMLNVLLYLQETLYTTITEWEVMVLFGERMIDYQMFDVLKEIIYESNVLETMSIDPVEFTENLIRISLEKIYDDESIVNFESVKDYMYDILHLQREKTPQYIVQENRIRLCDLVSESNFQISPHRVYRLKRKDSELLMMEFIEQGFETLNLSRMFQIYSCIQSMFGEEPDLTQTEILSYLAKFARILKDNNKLMEAGEVLVYLIQHSCFEDLYALVTEVVIMSLQEKYPQDFGTARVYLQCYALNLESSTSVMDALNCQFDIEKVSQFAQGITEITLEPSLTFYPLRNFGVELNVLEGIARDAMKLASKITDPADYLFYRYYYFLLVALTKPERGFLLDDIDYEYAVLEAALERLGSVMASVSQEQQSHYPRLNEYQLRTHFFMGLWNLAQIKTEHQVRAELDIFKPLDNEFEYVTVVNILKERKEFNLVKMMVRCQKYLLDNRNTYLMRAKKAEKYLAEVKNKTADIEIEDVRPPQEEACSVIENKLNKTMTFGEYLQEVSNLTYQHRNISERQLNSMIWEDVNRRGGKNASPPNTKMENLSEAIAEQPMLLHEEEPMVATEEDGQREDPDRLSYIFSLFDESKYFEIENLDRSELKSCMRQYYESNRDIHSIIKLMQAAKIGEDKNIKIVQSALRIRTPIDPIDIKQLFSFDYYFFVPEQASPRQDEGVSKEGYFYWQIFNYLTPVLRQMVTAENVLELSKIFYISLKYEKQFEYRIYLLVLEKLIKSQHSVSPTKFSNLAEEYITKMSISRRFLFSHYRDILQMCRSRETLETIRQKLLTVLRRKDSKDTGQEATDQEILDQAIREVEEFTIE